MPHRPTTIDVYDRNATEFSARYETMAFEHVHAQVLCWIPGAPGRVLDIGAGSGRDAAWFAQRGHVVFAVEPAVAMREQASRRHPHPNITWVDDQLPELAHIGGSAMDWDLIWLSAVWMHLTNAERRRAFPNLVKVLRPGGRMIISLRHGAFDDGRIAHPVSIDEIVSLARGHGLGCRDTIASGDVAERHEVHWETVILDRPAAGGPRA